MGGRIVMEEERLFLQFFFLVGCCLLLVLLGNRMYYDLNIPIESPQGLTKEEEDKIKMAVKLGYDAVATNYTVSANKITPKDMCTLSPIPFSSLKLAPSPSGGMGALRVGCGDVQTRMGGRFQFKQFKRITIEVDDSSKGRWVQTSAPIVNSYDLFAVKPLSEKALQLAVSTLEVDIITMDLAQRLPFPLRRNLINQAIARGIVLEISYSPTLRGGGGGAGAFPLNYFVSNANNLVKLAKGRNIVISSGAANPMELRNPYDVMHICGLISLSSSDARLCLTKEPTSALMRGTTRSSTQKAVLSAVPQSSLEESEKWVLEGKKRKGPNGNKDEPKEKKAKMEE